MVDLDFKPLAASASGTRTDTVLLKVCVLGSSNVGKTSLLTRFVHKKFDPTRRVTTGADFASKVLRIDGKEVRLVIWDTAGQERFHHGTLGNAFYRGADGALLVYDTTDAKTFEQIDMWRGELLQRVEGKPEDFPVVVVGNKIDLPGGGDQQAVRTWCRDLGIGLCLTSAKDGTGVAAAMEAIAVLAVENKYNKLQAAARNTHKKHHSSRINDPYSGASSTSSRPDTVALDDLRRHDHHSSSGCCK
mmetsp:Transcript_6941/g.22579  ORF Transcript_6941/g.22579 Transcript_6941/m.22579 type:complete len:246 (-) Transcript_6941:143-880(-)|eukprot:CAMPEP_0118900032 /NCGR_PEP_ID=MMETSP1166-20130328/6326_1 /TAXON_ID=1104430 /ORGANISM="Chrysoreinhardia sp, Strain CCMP3193" /LENGTH=245 /DNA_ID=CAMNT_0006839165 /DNA_START=130 /DNA_END=867 /DNA_ORIENTATION=+